ncbi:hypothetical protein RRG08_066803 [Elysia crispata]|uniref:Uncharacterized protein n=1 Tax=Elysia crispata TaxID=231223 RepID=A0AAE0Y7X4_9GAST|nr:hypothetical protein RRG08_066803 [Elysia crispata]
MQDVLSAGAYLTNMSFGSLGNNIPPTCTVCSRSSLAQTYHFNHAVFNVNASSPGLVRSTYIPFPLRVLAQRLSCYIDPRLLERK